MADPDTQQSALLFLPDEVLENVLSFLTYEEVSKSRLICRKANLLCQQFLNSGFNRADKYHGQCQRNVRCLLPRRESERRNHPLARHVDILAAIETRLSLLHMTFMKYIDMGLCCFIPGKVLDEVFRVMRLVQHDQKPPRAHELLQELRDISSMAMEHFDEVIVPVLRTRMPQIHLGLSTSNLPIPSTSTGTSYRTESNGVVVNTRVLALRQDILKVRYNIRSTHMTVAGLRKEVTEAKSESDEMTRKLAEQGRQLADQERTISEQGRKITEQGKLINDMNEKLSQYDQKLASLFTGLAKLQPAEGETRETGSRGAVIDETANNANKQTRTMMPSQDVGEEVTSGDELMLTRKRRKHCRKSGGRGGVVKRSRVR